MKLVFVGTGTFAVPILQKIATGTEWGISLVVAQQPKPAGRGRKETVPPIHQKALELGLDVFAPKTLKDETARNRILSYNPEIIITAAYGKIIPAEIFDTPKHKTVNIHPSLLPKLRGPSPIQWALLEGMSETGVSLMLIDEELDHGPIISQEKISVAPNDTYDTLETKLAALGAEMVVRDVPRYAAGELVPQEQNHANSTYSKMIKKEDGRVDWSEPAEKIYNQWRAFVRWPGIFTFAGSRRLNLKKISLGNPISKSVPGVFFVSGDGVFVATGSGLIQIHEIQPEGKRVLDASEFINGYRQLLDEKLG